jgi:hypothetical protein
MSDQSVTVVVPSEPAEVHPAIVRPRTPHWPDKRPAPAWTTPGRIRALAAICLLATVVVFVVTALSLSSVRSGLSVIGHRTSPEVVSASGVYFALNDMDAQVANLLLVGNRDDLGSTRKQSMDRYESDRLTVDHNLQPFVALAAKDAIAQQQAKVVLDGLGQYEALATEALLLEQRAVNPQPGRPPADAVNSFRRATDSMHSTLLPAAKSLTDANSSTLDRTCRDRRASIGRALLWVVLLGGILIGALLVFQLYLAVRMHRLLNPAVAMATVIGAILVVLSAVTLSSERHHLKVAKQDAFDSLVVLSQARAVSHDANAEEPLPRRPGTSRSISASLLRQHPQQVVHLTGATISTYDSALGEAAKAYAANHSDVRFGGYLGSEFRNITFNGERAAAEQTLVRWQVYQRDDRRIRALNVSGNRRARRQPAA